MSDDIKEKIDADVKSNKVILFMKGTREMPQCGFSARVTQILVHLGVDFQDRNVLADPALRQGIKDYSQWPTIPQLYVGSEFIGGCDIIMEMFENGELQQALQDAGAIAGE